MVKLKLFKLEEQDEKCGGCNWRVRNLYVLATSQEEAEEIYRKGEGGLCGDCMCDLLVDMGYEIENSPPSADENFAKAYKAAH